MAEYGHSHVFLAEGHAQAERRSWSVIWLCVAMMILEIGGGLWFGSIALVADGLHMSTHAGALLLAAMAYSYARRHAHDPRFAFGTGKLGDLAGFTSAIVLAMISLLIGYEALLRLFVPISIQFSEAIPIACLGLAVNIASVWLLGGGNHDHAHGHGHSHGHAHAHGEAHRHGHDHDEQRRIETPLGTLLLSIYEENAPPRFRLQLQGGGMLPDHVHLETVRPDGARQVFNLRRVGHAAEDVLESVEDVPEPHAFAAVLRFGDRSSEYLPEYVVEFAEHVHGDAKAGRDNNMRAAIVHVIADALVSVMVIVGLLLARAFGWVWMDPVAGVIGAGVIASWAYGLVRDTGAILLDMTPDHGMQARLREAIEADGDRLADLHMWRLGPGHLGAIVSVITQKQRTPSFYRARLARFRSISHVTIEVEAAK